MAAFYFAHGCIIVDSSCWKGDTFPRGGRGHVVTVNYGATYRCSISRRYHVDPVVVVGKETIQLLKTLTWFWYGICDWNYVSNKYSNFSKISSILDKKWFTSYVKRTNGFIFKPVYLCSIVTITIVKRSMLQRGPGEKIMQGKWSTMQTTFDSVVYTICCLCIDHIHHTQ